MYKKIRGWFAKKREAEKENAFEEGFAWASTEILRGRLTMEEVEMRVNHAIDWGPFDAGASLAISTLQRLMEDSQQPRQKFYRRRSDPNSEAYTREEK